MVLIGNGVDIDLDKVPNVELELLIGATELDVDEIWLEAVTFEVELDELVRILEGSPLESSGTEFAEDEILVEDARIGSSVDVTENVFKDREDTRATLVKDEADVDITADDITPKVDVGRLVRGSEVEKVSVLLNNDDSERDSIAVELPG